MQISIDSKRANDAIRQLDGIVRSIDSVTRGALNTAITQIRRDRYVTPLRGTLKGVRVRRALRVKRATSRHRNSRIIPSSSGIPVLEYAHWGLNRIDKTRAEVWVRGLSGKKIAAGFANPSSQKRLPWDTRSKYAKAAGRRAWAHRRPAMGPSSAYWFKQLTDRGTMRWAEEVLHAEFERRLRVAIDKGAR